MKAKFTMPENNAIKASFNYDKSNTIATKAELKTEIEARIIGDENLNNKIDNVILPLATKSELEDEVNILDNKIDAVADSIPDISDLATKQELEEVEESIPDVSNLATKTELQTVQNKIPTKASDINALPDTTTINDLTTEKQQSAINSGIKASDVTLIGSALQPNDNITKLNNNAGFITNADLPTKTSDLTNDSGFITKLVGDLSNYYLKSETYTKQEVNSLIADIPKFTVTVVEELPLIGQPMVLYLVPKDSEVPDVHNEYIWITSTSSYELIGSTAVDLDGYAKEQWVQNQGYITDVISALGYAPYNSSNPQGYTSNKGTVTSVNNEQPNVDGNVTITIPDVSGLATKTELENGLREKYDASNPRGYVTGSDLPDTTRLSYYGTSSTGAATQTKVVVCEGFTLKTGVSIRVKFDSMQNYNGQPKLNVNSTGAINIVYYGTAKAARYAWTTGEVVSFTYDGTNWVMEDGGIATTTIYGVTKLTTSATSTNTASALTPATMNLVALNMIEPYPVYSTADTYQVGERVRYSANAWECNTPIETPEAWNAEHWTKLEPIQTQIDDMQNEFKTNSLKIGNTTITESQLQALLALI